MADVKFSELTALAAADVASADILAIVDTSASVSKKITIDSLFGAVPVNIVVEDTTNSTSTTTGSIQTDGGIGAAKSVVVGDDLSLKSDAAVLNFGADSDVSLTHIADTGVRLNTSSVVQFRDAAIYVGSATTDGQLDIVADTEVQIDTTTLDINGAVDVSSTLSVTSGITGLSTLTMTGNILPAASGTVDLGSDSAEFNDMYLADSSVLNFGSGQDVSLTHVLNTGLLLTGTSAPYLQIRDSALSIGSSADGQLDIAADTEVQIDTTTVDLNGALDVSGAITGGSTITMTGNILPSASGTVDIGSTGAEFNDVFLADASVVNFGDDQDVTLTHVADTGLLLNSASVIQFRDSALYVGSTTDGQLDVVADTTLDLTAPTITLTGGGTASSVLKHATDGYDLQIQQVDGNEVARIFDGGATLSGGDTDEATGVHGGFGFRRPVLSIDASAGAKAVTLTDAESGAIIKVDVSGTTSATVTLPAVGASSEGVFYDFLIPSDSGGTGGDLIIATAASDSTIQAFVSTNSAGSVTQTYSAGGDQLTIGSGDITAGSWVRCTAVVGSATTSEVIWTAQVWQTGGTASTSA